MCTAQLSYSKIIRLQLRHTEPLNIRGCQHKKIYEICQLQDSFASHSAAPLTSPTLTFLTHIFTRPIGIRPYFQAGHTAVPDIFLDFKVA